MEKTTYNKKYKDRDPLDTVKTIKDFFEKYNFEIIEDLITEKESTSWYCDLSLVYKPKNKIFLVTHGKGIDKDFALASGYAEMFERFSNGIVLSRYYTLNSFRQKYNKEHFGYYLDPEEIIATNLKDYIIDENFKKLLSFYVDINKNDFGILTKLSGDNNALVPFKNISNNDDKWYMNPSLFIQLTGSNGMAAGNTFEEATVQGISENIERECLYRYGKSINAPFYNIDLNSIKSPAIHKMIDAIEETGNKVIIIDLSYNYNWPVVLAYIYNPTSLVYTCFSRCHPVFELAVEGAITECYQRGCLINDESIYYGNDFRLFKTWIKEMSRDNNILSQADRDFNSPAETLFIDSITKDSCNMDCFLADDTYTTNELLDYYRNLFKVNNARMYVYETSLCKEFRSVLTYCPEFKPYNCDVLEYNEGQAPNFSFIINSNDIVKDILHTTILKGEQMDNIAYFLAGSNLISVFNTNFEYHLNTEFSEFNMLLLMLLNDFQNCGTNEIFAFYTMLINSEYADYIRKYALLFKYKLNDYSKEETRHIFEYAGQQFLDKDWYCCDDIKYICSNIIYPAYKEMYSDDFLEGLLAPYLQGPHTLD